MEEAANEENPEIDAWVEVAFDNPQEFITVNTMKLEEYV